MRINPWDVPRLSVDEKVCSYSEMPELIGELKLAGRRVVLAQGVFDLLHLGHIQYLERAAQHGLVVVGLESDEAVRVNKGPTRPINSLDDRLLAIAAFRHVGLVFGFEDAPLYSDPDSYHAYVARYRTLGASIAIPEEDPNWQLKTDQAVDAGVDVVCINGHHPNSTTQLLQTLNYLE